jgi:uncharacterized protein (TIGR02284 family)
MEYEGAVMRDDEIVDALNDLIELDHNAIGAYNSAINGLEKEHSDISNTFKTFRADHERHVQELSPFVQRYGGKPAKHPGAMGLLQKGWTEISKMGGADAILSAMVSNEQTAVNTYEQGVTKAFPSDILRVVERGASDERRHLSYCQSQYERLKKAA